MLQEDDIFIPRVIEPPFLSALHAKNDTKNLFGYKLGESAENNKALIFSTFLLYYTNGLRLLRSSSQIF